MLWPAIAAGLLLSSWILTLLARRWNARSSPRAFYVVLCLAIVSAAGGGAALVLGPWLTGLDPASHSYPATVWLLVIWTALHVVLGVIMQIYCLARRLARRMTREHDIDLQNTTLYWHFAILTAITTVLVIAGFPLVA